MFHILQFFFYKKGVLAETNVLLKDIHVTNCSKSNNPLLMKTATLSLLLL